MEISCLSDKEWYASVIPGGHEYFCKDFKVRSWDDMIKEFGSIETNRMSLFETRELIDEALKHFKITNPEYFV